MEYEYKEIRFDSFVIAGALLGAAAVLTAFSPRYDIVYASHAAIVVRVDRYTGRLEACPMQAHTRGNSRELSYTCDGIIRR